MKDATLAMDILYVLREEFHGRKATLRALGAQVRKYRKGLGRSAPPDPSIRCQLQRRCSQCSQYQGREDWFYMPNPGYWQLRVEA